MFCNIILLTSHYHYTPAHPPAVLHLAEPGTGRELGVVQHFIANRVVSGQLATLSPQARTAHFHTLVRRWKDLELIGPSAGQTAAGYLRQRGEIHKLEQMIDPCAHSGHICFSCTCYTCSCEEYAICWHSLWLTQNQLGPRTPPSAG